MYKRQILPIGECRGGNPCQSYTTQETCEPIDNQNGCVWTPYSKQEICEGGGKAFNIMNNCESLTCDNWYFLEKQINTDPCGVGKKLNKTAIITSGDSYENICCEDQICDVHSCEPQTGIFKPKAEVQAGSSIIYESPQTDMTRICCDIKTCDEVLGEDDCPIGLERHQHLSLIHI